MNEIIKNIKVPTGNILIVNGERGLLELVSLGDYGQNINVKADFLGLSRDINKVIHTDLQPLSEKWVVTISTQYGCKMNCIFCDVPMAGSGLNVSESDLINQIETALSLHPEIVQTERLNIHFARMGEPTWNPAVCSATSKLIEMFNDAYNLHPVVSTMMPVANGYLKSFLQDWMYIKNNLLNGNAGLQLSINSTNELERTHMFNGNACTILEIAHIMQEVPRPVGRKITLNFAVAEYEIDANILIKYFNPKYYIVKLTPMHKTKACVERDLYTLGDYTSYYPYKQIEENLKSAGYDVIVFIASKEEDISGITCGNAILGYMNDHGQ